MSTADEPDVTGQPLFDGTFSTEAVAAAGAALLEQLHADGVERRLDRCDLLEDLRAPAVVGDHRLDPAGLALDPAQAREQLVLGRAVAARGGRAHTRHYTP
jgi:hypothetical protein